MNLNVILNEIKENAKLIDEFNGYTFDIKQVRDDMIGFYALRNDEENKLNSYVYAKNIFADKLSSSQLSMFILGVMNNDIQSKKEGL